MDNNRKFTIVEFSDGLQIVPTTWLSTTKETCIWPSHMKTQLRINRAIMTGEMPKEQYDWGELPVKRIFGGASTYEKSMEKLILAQDTSNVDDTGMSSGDTRERDKKRRRIRAKRKVSSSSDDEELVANKENHRTLNNILPPFPEIEKFVSNSAQQKEICTQHIENIMYEDIFTNAFIDKDVSLQIQNKKEPVTPVTPVKSVTPKNIHVDKEDSSNQEAVRLNISYSQTTNAEIADFISKWLAQAPLRTKREMKRIQTEEK